MRFVARCCQRHGQMQLLVIPMDLFLDWYLLSKPRPPLAKWHMERLENIVYELERLKNVANSFFLPFSQRCVTELDSLLVLYALESKRLAHLSRLWGRFKTWNLRSSDTMPRQWDTAYFVGSVGEKETYHIGIQSHKLHTLAFIPRLSTWCTRTSELKQTVQRTSWP